MNKQKTLIATAITAVLGTVGFINAASAAVVADGTYNLVINTTPTMSVGSSGTNASTAYNFGRDGRWNSSFTMGGYAPSTSSFSVTDNGMVVTSNGGPRGSSIGGDGWAGILGITVSGSAFTVNGVSSMGGTINQSTGAMTLDVTGRLGAFSGFPALYDERWNVDNCTIGTSRCTNNGNTVYEQFSTGSAYTYNSGGGAPTINGASLASTGDLNGDGLTDFKAILVSGGQMGSDWGGFYGVGYFEVWSIQLRSTAAGGLHSGFNVDVVKGTGGGEFAQYVNAVPVPAAAWLFGSGLIGLIGVARRKQMT